MVVSKIPVKTQDIPIQAIDFLSNAKVEVFILRLDLVHPYISGNKYFKLKHNMQAMRRQGKSKIISFGGAYSNHIRALAYAGFLYDFHTIGLIRGEELANKTPNKNLAFAKQCGMELQFISREEYRKKSNPTFLQTLQQKNPNAYILPEGGTNHLAVKGCQEILSKQTNKFTHLACAVGTGGTIAGIINASLQKQWVLGFSALKNAYWLEQEIQTYTQKKNHQLFYDYHFGGYAKKTINLTNFEKEFKQQTNIPIEPIYTSKMFFGIQDLIQKEYFPTQSKILCVHTGGIF